jgi:UDP-N-acetylglucosamine diphosphorylase/glucosamine-1-phosphate N-acetyltransferase
VNVVPVLFEDHNLARMRPLSWSAPVFELRCGMFSTRERVSLCTGGGGVLLGRSMLRNLNRASGWDWGADSIPASGGDDNRFLFLNGMLAPDFSLIQGLIELAGDNQDFVLRDGQELVAAVVGAELAMKAAEKWDSWEKENASQGVWTDPARIPPTWTGADFFTGEISSSSGDLTARLDKLATLQGAGPSWVWEIVGCTKDALSGDLEFVKDGVTFKREPFGICPGQDQPAPDWAEPTTLEKHSDLVYCGEGVDLAPGTAIDTSQGPVILDRNVRVMPNCFLEGPLYIGPGSLVKPGARIHGDSSFGVVNRLAGEIGESTFGDFANKQHEGFIGHAVLGSWINLGAMTTCSDLKNNYGEIRVDLGSGTVATGSRFVGLMMGDHAKTAIGTLFNTGTSVGFASNIFGAGMPPKYVGNFQWGGQDGCPLYAVDRAQDTAGIVMARRGCQFTDAHGKLFTALA